MSRRIGKIGPCVMSNGNMGVAEAVGVGAAVGGWVGAGDAGGVTAGTSARLPVTVSAVAGSQAG